MAAQLYILLTQTQLLAGSDVDLLLHQIHPRDHLGDRMLDLDARVHFDEVELAFLIEELKGARAAIADFPAGFDAALADLVA